MNVDSRSFWATETVAGVEGDLLGLLIESFVAIVIPIDVFAKQKYPFPTEYLAWPSATRNLSDPEFCQVFSKARRRVFGNTITPNLLKGDLIDLAKLIRKSWVEGFVQTIHNRLGLEPNSDGQDEGVQDVTSGRWRPDKASAGSLRGRVSDNRRGNETRAGVASFFLATFLGCRLRGSPREVRGGVRAGGRLALSTTRFRAPNGAAGTKLRCWPRCRTTPPRSGRVRSRTPPRYCGSSRLPRSRSRGGTGPGHLLRQRTPAWSGSPASR